MKYTEPKMSLVRFDTVFASGDGTVPAEMTASELGYDVSVSYEEVFLTVTQAAQSIVEYRK